MLRSYSIHPADVVRHSCSTSWTMIGRHSVTTLQVRHSAPRNTAVCSILLGQGGVPNPTLSRKLRTLLYGPEGGIQRTTQMDIPRRSGSSCSNACCKIRWQVDQKRK